MDERINTEKTDNPDPQVVVNATPLLGNLTGVGHVTAEIAGRADAEFDVDYFTALKTFCSYDEIRSRSLQLFCLRMIKAGFRRLPFRQALRDVSAQIGHSGTLYDLYWEPNFIPLESIQARRVITTVHDMSFHEHPEWHPKDRVAFFSKNFFEHIGRSDVVVTVSQFSRERFLESQSEVGGDRVCVIPCGINHDVFRVLPREQVDEFKKRYGLPDHFVLFVGSIEPRKNLITLLNAYEQLPREQREACPLVLVGGSGWNNRNIHERIVKIGRGVRTFGYLKSQDDLALMVNAATVFAYPSLYEGFGIPPLEAMACGTPVCLSSIPVFHEVYGEDSACYADPQDAESISAALSRLIEDEDYCSQLVQQGFQVAQRYTWDRAYEGYAELFRSLL